jgi:glycosyltransferase involved in cell wall biosynthesis|tara:strand:+ start:2515 stop:3417 length:903 start_codon:yes stop_codon:yes gene_type:complete
MNKITTVIPTFNNLPYLKLVIKSVRQNAYYNDMPIVVFAENCTDGTDEWLNENSDELNIEFYIEKNEIQRGIGGGIDFCVSKVKTEFVNILHSDFWIAPNQDIELLKLYDGLGKGDRLITSSFRVQPDIFPNDPEYRPGTVFVPMDEFGAHDDTFEQKYFDEWATQFSKDNDIQVRKSGGAGYFCRVEDHIHIGGNDPIFEPMYWEDKDLFMRMQMEGYKFIMTSKSVVWHFTSRTSRFPDNTKNLDNNQRPPHLVEWEQRSMRRFIEKWGRLPVEDGETFVAPIYGTENPNRMEWPFNG